MTLNTFHTPNNRIAYFKRQIHHHLRYWHQHDAINTMEIATLDKRRDSILSTITFGLDLPDAWTQTRDLMITFSTFMERRGYWDTWNKLLAKAIEVARQVEDVDGEITLSALLARLHQRQSRPKDVVYWYRRVIRRARKAGNRYEEARACSNLGYAYIDGGRWWRSKTLCQHALQIFEDLKSDHGKAHTHNHLGLLNTRRKKWLEAETNLNEACRLWKLMKDNYALLYGLENIGALLLDMQLPEKAINSLKDALTYARLTGEETEVSKIWNNLGRANEKAGNFSEAETYFKKAEKALQSTFNRLELARVWHNLGWLYCRQARWKESEKYFVLALKIYQGLENLNEEINILEDIISCELQRGNFSNASTHLAELEKIHSLNEESIQRIARFRQKIQHNWCSKTQ
ncbi:MAG: tetratricopeptide repeat protein [Chloroflexota bacterium]